MKTAYLWLRIMPIIGLLFFTACHSSEVFEQASEECEVMVSLFVEAPKTRVGDPGSSADETTVYWNTIELFFVYDEGRVIRHTLSKEEFESSENKRFLFQMPEGRIAVYGVAYGEGQKPLAVTTSTSVKELRTNDITQISDLAEKKTYLLSLFSGTAPAQEVTAHAVTNFGLTLNRLIAKVDIQWDAQGAYSQNGYTDVKMGAISLSGLAQGYFFPEEVNLESENLTDNLQTYSVSDPISQRNGRTYFYAFSGVKNHIKFNIDYTSDAAGEVTRSYDAVFTNALNKASWHKVNFTVKGTKTSTTNNIELSL